MIRIYKLLERVSVKEFDLHPGDFIFDRDGEIFKIKFLSGKIIEFEESISWVNIDIVNLKTMPFIKNVTESYIRDNRNYILNQILK